MQQQLRGGGMRMMGRKQGSAQNGINFNDLQMNYTPAPLLGQSGGAGAVVVGGSSGGYTRKDSSPMRGAASASTHSSYSQMPLPPAPSSNENFKVVIRTRPPLEKEIDEVAGFDPIVRVNPDGRSVIIHEYLGAEISQAERQRDIYENPHLVQRHVFSFDRVYDTNATQAEVYAHTAQAAVLSTLEGYNATILAYGQTGTGKTHTMEGFRYNSTDPQRGIVPRSMEEIFKFIETKSAPKSTFMVRASYLQIYNEVISDLLKNDRTSLAIREDRKRGVFVEGLSEWAVRTPGEIFSLLQKGAQSRATASTKMNDVSSRSHAVFIIIVEQMTSMIVGDEATKQIKVGKLNLVDLAGSERVRVTGATGKRLEESKSINQSLSCLGNVISALTDAKGRTHIPYRDSKLTRLLEDSLGGNCKTTMMAMISPTHEAFSESMSTLKFATRAKKIKNEARVNEDVDQRALLRKYEIELKRLKDQLAQKNESIVNDERMMELENEKRRAEEDKAAAITALEARSREFVIQKEEKKKLEEKIRFLGSQVLVGGKKIEDLPQFRSALEAQQRIIREEYEGKLADIERERQQIEEDKAQVDRYKQLLLKQRDIMIALTARLNERDQTIIQLQEELDAYDCIHKESEEQIEMLRARNAQLETMAVGTPDVPKKQQREAIANILEKDINGLVKDIIKQLQEQENPQGLYNINQQLNTLHRLIAISANGIRNEEAISLEGELSRATPTAGTNLRYHAPRFSNGSSGFEVLGVRNATAEGVIPFNAPPSFEGGKERLVHEMLQKRKQERRNK